MSRAPRFPETESNSPIRASVKSLSSESARRSRSSFSSSKESNTRKSSKQKEEENSSASPPSDYGEKNPPVKRSSDITKRSNSLDRKMGSADRRKANNRPLKKVSSMIPRAVTNKLRENSATEMVTKKPTSRKSDTSVKIKKKPETEEELSTKTKKLERKKSSRTAVILNSKSYHSSTSGENFDLKKPTSPRSTSKLKQPLVFTASVPPPKVVIPVPVPLPKHKIERKLSSSGEIRLAKKPPPTPKPSTPSMTAERTSKNIEAQYQSRKKIFLTLKKEVEEKQKLLTEHYKGLNQTRERLILATGKELPVEEDLKKFSSNMNNVDTSQDNQSDNIEKIVTFETKLFKDVEADFQDFNENYEYLVLQIPEIWRNMATLLANSRKELIKKVTEHSPNFDKSMLEMENESLRLAFENAKLNSKVKTDDLLSEIKKLFLNRETLKNEMKLIMNSPQFTSMISKEYKGIVERLKELDEVLEKEKIRYQDLLEKRDQLEDVHRMDQEMIQNLQDNVAMQEEKLVELTNQIRTLKMKESQQSGNFSMKTKVFKDLRAKTELLTVLENRITELTNEHNNQKKKYERKMGEMENQIEQKKKELESETCEKQRLQTALSDMEEKVEKIREKKKLLSDLVEKSKLNLQPNSGMTPSKREEELWTQLEAMKVVIKGFQDQVVKLQEEKNRILLKFQTIAEDKTNEQCERLAAELVRKDDIIKSQKLQLSDLQKACGEHTAKYNKLQSQLRDFQDRIQEGKSDPVSLSRQIADMRSQINDLQQTINELIQHNQQLETTLGQRSLELDQRDRLVKQQCNLLKVRDELIGLLRSKDENQDHEIKKFQEQDTKWEKRTEKIYRDLEKKSHTLDDMYKILQEKQNQVDKLNKVVKMMEDQQDRAQEQRVRFESKIAELQKQLLDKKQKSAKKSLFED